MRNLIAILRGVKPSEIEDIARVLIDSGITKIEVPLNSPDPFESIARLISTYKGQGLFGAGTVLQISQVQKLHQIGADLIVSPNCDLDIIHATKAANMLSYPGVMTPSECFSALKAGADGLKFFPGDVIGTQGLKAVRAVLPDDTECLAVGGAKSENFADWVQAGANGFGIGSSLYKSGDLPSMVAEKADIIVKAYDKATNYDKAKKMA